MSLMLQINELFIFYFIILSWTYDKIIKINIYCRIKKTEGGSWKFAFL